MSAKVGYLFVENIIKIKLMKQGIIIGYFIVHKNLSFNIHRFKTDIVAGYRKWKNPTFMLTCISISFHKNLWRSAKKIRGVCGKNGNSKRIYHRRAQILNRGSTTEKCIYSVLSKRKKIKSVKHGKRKAGNKFFSGIR